MGEGIEDGKPGGGERDEWRRSKVTKVAANARDDARDPTMRAGADNLQASMQAVAGSFYYSDDKNPRQKQRVQQGWEGQQQGRRRARSRSKSRSGSFTIKLSRGSSRGSSAKDAARQPGDASTAAAVTSLKTSNESRDGCDASYDASTTAAPIRGGMASVGSVFSSLRLSTESTAGEGSSTAMECSTVDGGRPPSPVNSYDHLDELLDRQHPSPTVPRAAIEVVARQFYDGSSGGGSHEGSMSVRTPAAEGRSSRRSNMGNMGGGSGAPWSSWTQGYAAGYATGQATLSPLKYALNSSPQ